MSGDPSVPVFRIPEDLVQQVSEIADRMGESRQFVVVAAVEHFTRIPEEQRRAIIRATSMRRR